LGALAVTALGVAMLALLLTALTETRVVAWAALGLCVPFMLAVIVLASRARAASSQPKPPSPWTPPAPSSRDRESDDQPTLAFGTHPPVAMPPQPLPGAAPASEMSGLAALQTDAMEEPYELIERLSSGSMGEVWRARHRRLKRFAAIKIIKPGASESEDMDRFKREARMMAQLVSAHTVAIYDFGLKHDGELFYAMELLDGIDLQAFVERFGPMPPARVIRVLTQACHSLDEAHQTGLVHRDFKPANVMLCRHGRDVDFVKVLDFGLAKGVTEATVSEDLTSDGTVLGTPAYIAPESLKGSTNVDGQADIYALGCIAFWLLTGKMLFEERTAMGMVKAHVSSKPRRPSDVASQPIPALLDEMVLACVAKDPDKRTQGAAEVARRLSVVKPKQTWTDADSIAWWEANMPEREEPGLR